jgi:hypothetical protein
MAPDSLADARAARQRRRPKGLPHRPFVSGVGIALPLLVTLATVSFALNFISDQPDPVVEVVQMMTPNQQLQAVLIEVKTVAVLLAIVFLVGFPAEFDPATARSTRGSSP